MNKRELVDVVASSSGLTKADTSRVLDTFLATVEQVMKDGGEIVIPGFGSWSTVNRGARTGRNPQTGAPIQIKATRAVKFKAGKNLKEAVQ